MILLGTFQLECSRPAARPVVQRKPALNIPKSSPSDASSLSRSFFGCWSRAKPRPPFSPSCWPAFRTPSTASSPSATAFDRAWRLSRSARRQAADRLDFRRPRRQGRAAVVARHRGRLARYPDRHGRRAVLGARQPRAHQPALGQQGEHGGSDRARSHRPGRRRLRPRAGNLRILLVWITGVLTMASLAAYLRAWLRHMSGYESEEGEVIRRLASGA